MFWHPPLELFEGIEFLPVVFFSLVWMSLLVTIVLIRCTYFCYRRQIIMVRKNSKTYSFVFSCYDKLEKLNVLIFPRLFTEKILRSGTKEWKEVLFLDKRWPEYQGSKNPKTELMVLFAIFGIAIVSISALGFFRNFPVIRGRECREEQDNNFNTWYCYDYNSTLLNCSTSESSNSGIQCYAFSLDIGTSSAVAFGLYSLSSIVIYGIVFLRNCFCWMCRKCKIPVACGIYCYIVIVASFWFITTLCIYFFIITSRVPINNGYFILQSGETAYRILLDSIAFVFACFTLIIPIRMHRYGVDEWPTYKCLATVHVDEEAEVELTPRIDPDNRTNRRQYSPIED